MPITGILDGPFVESIHAAYRPIEFLVDAKNTDGTPVPPVVYCDIYILGIYYKSLQKQIYDSKDNISSRWKFDIQDALQERLTKKITNNGDSAIQEISELIVDVFCKFRSSGYNSDGFIQYEGTAPIQGTLEDIPTPGTGTVSNTFYVVNATLQHEDNQDLATHLSAYKNRAWAVGTYPLTHRPDSYKICRDDTDVFPIISNSTPARLTLHYLPKNSSIWQTVDFNAPCTSWTPLIPIIPGNIDLPDATAGSLYNFEIAGDGTVPISINNIVKPAWLVITSSGASIIFGGTPPAAAGAVAVSFDVINCFGVVAYSYVSTVTVTCVNIGYVSGLPLPNANQDQPYNQHIKFSGSKPFTLSDISLPAWLDVLILDDEAILFGTPNDTDVAAGVLVHFQVDSPCGSSFIIDTHIDVIATGSLAYADISNYTIDSGAITGVCDVEILASRNLAAKNSANAAGKTVQVNYHVIADNGCEGDYIIVFNPADSNILPAPVITMICGTGPCGSAVITITSLTIL